MKLEDLKIYNISIEMGEEVWNLVKLWDNFSKFNIGNQLLRSVDSIAANISEGFGRFHFKETKNFAFYARGSLFETKTWLTKSYNRDLITKEEYERFKIKINMLGKMLNACINSIGSNEYQVREDDVPYTILPTNPKSKNPKSTND